MLQAHKCIINANIATSSRPYLTTMLGNKFATPINQTKDYQQCEQRVSVSNVATVDCLFT